MDTDLLEKKRELLTMSFMRSKTKPSNINREKPSLVEMTREDFKRRLEQHKAKAKELIH